MTAPPAYRAVILDAGSNGTRAYVYRIQPAGGDVAHPVITELFTAAKNEMRQATPGIHRILGDPPTDPSDKHEVDSKLAETEIAKYLNNTFDDVIATLEGDPKPDDKCFLYATAGMRGLNASGPGLLGYHDTIINAAKEYILGKKFNPDKVECRSIPGTEEAKYGWIAANYSQGGNTWPYAKGYVEMGGASAQIAFLLPESLTKEQKASLEEVQQAFGWFNGGLNATSTEPVAGRVVLLASCQLGIVEGHNAYAKVLQGPANQVNATTVRDPTKTVDYNAKDEKDGKWTILGPTQDQGATLGERWEFYRDLINKAIEAQLLFAPHPYYYFWTLDKISSGLMALHKDYEFLAGSQFWWSMGLEDDAANFNFYHWIVGGGKFKGINNSVGDPDQDLGRGMSCYKGRWIASVMWDVFGLGWNNGQDMTFVPYNGPNKKRLSWTLGTVALLAAEGNLANLAPFVVA